ncbi:MAG: hypothetical protein FJX04_02150 [Alphaproteobacteria bacterium]|nr:hypothetical protein [Alphaproteobacteria bacterium]
MDSVFSIGAIALIVGLVFIIIVVQQYQQNAQYREIQDRLREIRQAEMLEQEARALRAERSGTLDPLSLLEAELVSRGSQQLTEEELIFVENARNRTKAINQQLVNMRHWMGPPFDLDWHEALERLPIIKNAFLAASFAAENNSTTQMGASSISESGPVSKGSLPPLSGGS